MSEDEPKCPLCHSTRAREAHSIIKRLGGDPSFAELWKRLDAAERDRDRMLNALQYIRDQGRRRDIALPPHMITVIHRALSKVEPALTPPKDH